MKIRFLPPAFEVTPTLALLLVSPCFAPTLSAAYSNLGVGRKGTPSEGRIFLNYDGGPKGRNTAAQIAVFNLTWILNGADVNDFFDLN